jgi:hypothetical protein
MILFLTCIAAELLDVEMSHEEKKKTGLHQLSDKQKNALQSWIDSHYEKRSEPIHIEIPEKKPNVSSIEVRGKETFVHLTDGTSWLISARDAPIAQGWINPDAEIIVQAGTLTNALSKSSVRATEINLHL